MTGEQTSFSSFNVVPPPQLTNQPALAVNGTRDTGGAGASVEVTVVNAEGENVQVVAERLGISTWEGEVDLKEGENKLAFRQLIGGTTSEPQNFTVTLDTTAPAPPSVKDALPICTDGFEYTIEGSIEEGASLLVDGQPVSTNGRNFTVTVSVQGEGTTVVLTAVDEAGNESEPVEVFIGQGLAIPEVNELPEVTNDLNITISGTKEAGLGVLFRKEGAEESEFVVEPDGEETWSFELDLEEGANTFYIGGRDINGEDSCAERGPFTITQSTVCPPVITNRDDLPQFTQDSDHTVQIERCEDVETVVAIDEQETEDAVLVEDADAGLNISHDLALEEGAHTIRYYNRDGSGLISPPAILEIEVDTLPPNPPVYNPEPGPTAVEANIELRGDKDSNTSLCVRVEPESECTERIAVNSSRSFGFDQDLRIGQVGNNICISSFDRSGNHSEETCAFIERLRNDAPTIIIQRPIDGAPIGTAPFNVEAIVTDDSGLTEVKICFNEREDCQDLDIHDDFDLYERQIVPPGNLENGETYTVTVNARNRGGVLGSATSNVLFVTEGILLSNSAPEQLSERARLAIDGEGRVHAVWSDFCSQDACAQAPESLPADIFHRVFDNGQWSPITLLSDDANDSESESPALATDTAGNVHVVWSDSGNIDGSGFDFDVVHRSFDIRTDAWSDITVVTPDSDLQDRAPSLATRGGGELHAVWERSGNGLFQIFYASTTDDEWTEPINASGDAGSDRAGNPQVAADSAGVAYIVWQDDGDILSSGTDTDIYLKTVDRGVFAETTVVSDANLDGISLGPRVAMSADDILHIAWEDTAEIFGSGNDFDIFYRSFAVGDGLSSYRLVSRGNQDGTSSEPSIAVSPLDSGSVFVSWTDDGACNGCGNDFDIFYSRSFGGIFGSDPILVSAGNFAETGEFPDLIFDELGKVLHIVWEDDSTVSRDGADRDIFYIGIQLEE